MFTIGLLVLLNACAHLSREENAVKNTVNFLHDVAPFTSDSLVNVVIELGFDVDSLEMLIRDYHGVIDIIKLWLLHYKGFGGVEILSVDDERDAVDYLKAAHAEYIE